MLSCIKGKINYTQDVGVGEMMINTDSIDDIKNEVNAAEGDTLFAFDCDEVLTTLSEQICKERGQQFLMEWLGRSHPNVSEDAIYDVATFVLVSNENFLVNSEMPELIEKLWAKNVKAVVLTALSMKPVDSVPDPMVWRVETLRSLGYDFEKFWPQLANKRFKQFDCEYPPAYSSGVICCGGTSKGASLTAFLKYARAKPSKIVFVDDKIENLEDVKNTCKSLAIDFVGIEYHGAKNVESKVQFSEKVLEYQLATLKEKKIWVSDVEAEKHISRTAKGAKTARISQIRRIQAAV
jgi:hypothetical protein